jgi:hypothetical protein
MHRSLSLTVVVALASPAVADPSTQGTRDVIVTPLDQFHTEAAQITPYLYLNRCTGGCTVNGGGANDARTFTSTIPSPGPHSVVEFANSAGQTGSAADPEWNALVTCMKEVYSPFAVTVTDVPPAGGLSFTMAIIAGRTGDIGFLGLPPGSCQAALGVAPVAPDCSAQDNVISFSFANCHGGNPNAPGGVDMNRIYNLCWTAAQESAHAFGLDHEYQFADGMSACNDPMTYRFDCGGEKFFRNKPASCGENAVRPCRCGGSQNSHLKILNVFGAGTSIIPPPTASVIIPVNGATVAKGFTTQVQAFSRRGIDRVELWLNGHKWKEAPGIDFGGNGQPQATYALAAPGNVPDGVIDVVAKAFDDLGAETDAATVTVMKGAACTDAATQCLAGQKCEGGKCFWDPPTGKQGDTCTYNEFCETGVCAGYAGEDSICTTECLIGVTGACLTGYSCEGDEGAATGTCLKAQDSGGCCSAGGSDTGRFAHFGLGAIVLALVMRRRRA